MKQHNLEKLMNRIQELKAELSVAEFELKLLQHVPAPLHTTLYKPKLTLKTVKQKKSV